MAEGGKFIGCADRARYLAQGLRNDHSRAWCGDTGRALGRRRARSRFRSCYLLGSIVGVGLISDLERDFAVVKYPVSLGCVGS